MNERRPPRGVRMSECRDCCDPIVFVLVDTGRRIPCNPLPDDRGNVAARVIGHNLHGFVISKDKAPTQTGPGSGFYPYRMVPHFATCEEQKHNQPKPAPPPDVPLF